MAEPKGGKNMSRTRPHNPLIQNVYFPAMYKMYGDTILQTALVLTFQIVRFFVIASLLLFSHSTLASVRRVASTTGICSSDESESYETRPIHLLTLCTGQCNNNSCCDLSTRCCNDAKGGCKNSSSHHLLHYS